VVGFNSFEDATVMSDISYVMRHKTVKKIYKITLENNKEVKVTEDHSVIVDRDGFLIEVKPTAIKDNDLIICLNTMENLGDATITRTKIKSIECLGEIDDYVYDISIDDQDPFFFANDILVHNTDSVYFSAYKPLQKEIDAGTIPWEKENIIALYDKIADEVNVSFSGYMTKAFHCPKSRGEVIAAGRELIASKGLFITKKRYAVLYFDKEGNRTDTAGSPGKMKAMGLDLKRSDTPVFVQDFLSELLMMVLTNKTEADVLARISQFRADFKSRPGWEKGSPKRANNVANYLIKENKEGRANMPGHVRASINWNRCRELYGDKYSMPITDGAKVIVCKLKNNPLGYTSIAYPVDELRIPQWFQELPFDSEAMEATIVDQKIDNLIGVLNWDVQSTETTNTFNKLFEF